jgi:hypothetical protein
MAIMSVTMRETMRRHATRLREVEAEIDTSFLTVAQYNRLTNERDYIRRLLENAQNGLVYADWSTEIELRDVPAPMRKREVHYEICVHCGGKFQPDRHRRNAEIAICTACKIDKGHADTKTIDYNPPADHIEGKPTMNYSTAIFLTNKHVRAVNVIYVPEKDGVPTDKAYTKESNRKMFKTFDKSLKTGDYVLVPSSTRHQMTIAQVAECDVEVPIELHESGRQIGWIICSVPADLLAGYAKVLDVEKEGIAMIKNAEKVRKTKELTDKLLEANPELAELGKIDTSGLLIEAAPTPSATNTSS